MNSEHVSRSGESSTKHPREFFKHCRVTSGGSILFEFEYEQTAQAVENGWTLELFGETKESKPLGRTIHAV